MIEETPDGIPGDAEVYSFSRGFRFIAAVGVVFGIVLAVLPICLQLSGRGNHGFIAPVFLGFAYLAWKLWRIGRTSAAASAQGLWHITPGERPRFIAWGDIEEITERPFMQRLTVTDHRGGRIDLEYQLDGFDRLRDTLAANTKVLREQRWRNVTEFQKERRTWDVVAGVFALFFGGLAFACFRDNEAAKAWPFVAFGVALPLASLLAVETRLCLTDRGILVTFALRRKFIPFSDVVDIQLQNQNVGRGNSIAVVRVVRTRGRPVDLAGFKGGSIPLYEALFRQWRETTTAI